MFRRYERPTVALRGASVLMTVSGRSLGPTLTKIHMWMNALERGDTTHLPELLLMLNEAIDELETIKTFAQRTEHGDITTFKEFLRSASQLHILAMLPEGTSEKARRAIERVIKRINQELRQETRRERLTRRGRIPLNQRVTRLFRNNKGLIRDDIKSSWALRELGGDHDAAYESLIEKLKEVRNQNGKLTEKLQTSLAHAIVEYVHSLEDRLRAEADALKDSEMIEADLVRELTAFKKELTGEDAERVRGLEKKLTSMLRRDALISRQMKREDLLEWTGRRAYEGKLHQEHPHLHEYYLERLPWLRERGWEGLKTSPDTVFLLEHIADAQRIYQNARYPEQLFREFLPAFATGHLLEPSDLGVIEQMTACGFGPAHARELHNNRDLRGLHDLEPFFRGVRHHPDVLEALLKSPSTFRDVVYRVRTFVLQDGEISDSFWLFAREIFAVVRLQLPESTETELLRRLLREYPHASSDRLGAQTYMNFVRFMETVPRDLRERLVSLMLETPSFQGVFLNVLHNHNALIIVIKHACESPTAAQRLVQLFEKNRRNSYSLAQRLTRMALWHSDRASPETLLSLLEQSRNERDFEEATKTFAQLEWHFPSAIHDSDIAFIYRLIDLLKDKRFASRNKIRYHELRWRLFRSRFMGRYLTDPLEGIILVISELLKAGQMRTLTDLERRIISPSQARKYQFGDTVQLASPRSTTSAPIYMVRNSTPFGYVLLEVQPESVRIKERVYPDFVADDNLQRWFEKDKRYFSVEGLASMGFITVHVTDAYIGKDAFADLEQNLKASRSHPGRYDLSASTLHPDHHGTSMVIKDDDGITGSIGVVLKTGYIVEAHGKDAFVTREKSKNHGRATRLVPIPTRTAVRSEMGYNELVIYNWTIDTIFHTRNVEPRDEVIARLSLLCHQYNVELIEIDHETRHTRQSRIMSRAEAETILKQAEAQRAA
jgi:hypothetical protein